MSRSRTRTKAKPGVAAPATNLPRHQPAASAGFFVSGGKAICCLAIGGIYIDPSVHLFGRDALSLHITSVQARRPGASVELVSGIDAHHQVLRFEWRVVQSDWTCGLTSTDFGEVSVDGLLSKIIGFFGPAPHGDR